MTLSILICSIDERVQMLDDLTRHLYHQVKQHRLQDEVEILIALDNRVKSIGTKRNELLKAAKGKYITFIDDDDQVSDRYVPLIVNACKHNTDCIGIKGTMTTNGKNRREWFISKDYKEWFERGGVYYRTPNHISPVKRELALQVMFPEKNHGEDSEYSEKIHPLLKTEVKIKEPIYTYRYCSK